MLKSAGDQGIESPSGRKPVLSALLVALCACGCSNQPSGLVARSINASSATSAAFELYDSNKDGNLDEKELAACPGVLAALAVYDTDHDGQVSADEMTARIEAWKNSAAMMTVDCLVTLDGRPLSGAEVKFVPEKYLAESLFPATGVTEPNGQTTIGIAAENLPADHARLRAVYPGAYKVEITHPTTPVPSKFNTATTLGREVSKETRAPIVEKFELTTK